MPQKKITVTSESSGVRIDVFISGAYPAISRTKIQKFIEDGHVLLNSVPAKKRTGLKPGDIIEINEDALTSSTELHLEAQDISLDILYEDKYLVAVNKPAAMVVHPGSGNREGTLVNALLFHIDSLSTGSAHDRPGIVHRLDKETSGVIIAAKNDKAHFALSSLFSERTVEKQYIGFCIGAHPLEHDIIDAPIGRKKNDPIRFCVRNGGKESVTEYTLLSHKAGISLISFFPKTGRTHQIRVHAASRGFPVVADELYGGGKIKAVNIQPLDRPFVYKIYDCFERHALHARKLSFVHPFTRKKIALEAPFPEDFMKAIDLIEYRDF